MLIKGFKSGVRGWIGSGRIYIRSLGATNFGTPVTLPADENPGDNLWVRWAAKDPETARLFWDELRGMSGSDRHPGRAALFLFAAREFLEERGPDVPGSELLAHARNAE